MENPHDERQAVLLERIVRNTVRIAHHSPRCCPHLLVKEKCSQLVIELNRCIEEIVRANQNVRVVNQLETKYRKNVEYNLKTQSLSAQKPAPSDEA